MSNLIKRLYHHPLLSSLMHTLVHELQRELRDCGSVIDLGCGPNSPLQYCSSITYSIGVEAFQPYLEQSKAKKIHTEYRNTRLEYLDFPDKCVDAVIMIDVLEHLPEELGHEVLAKAQRWARKKIIISSPNGFVEQSALDGNELQKHLSGWSYSCMRSMGYDCKGMAGPKCLRREVEGETMGDDLMVSIRYRPRVFWFLIATILQPIVYYCPRVAFSLFSVRKFDG